MSNEKMVDEKYAEEMAKKMVEDDKFRDFIGASAIELIKSYKLRELKKLFVVVTGALISSIVFDEVHKNKPYNIDYTSTKNWKATATIRK